jgi:uncharacterized membrane protein
MPVWLSVVAGAVLPRLEQAYLPGYTHRMSVSAALAFFSAVSSGMMALTGIVFAIAFVAVQFSALAYSPGLVVMFADSPPIYHALGVFFATFTYSLAALIWTDRGGSGTVPFFSALLVTILLIVSMLAFARLIRSVNNLQVHNVLQVIGTRVRSVICAMLPRLQQGANGTVSTEIEVQEILARQPRQSAIPANRARSQDTISIPWHDWRRPMPSSPSNAASAKPSLRAQSCSVCMAPRCHCPSRR